MLCSVLSLGGVVDQFWIKFFFVQKKDGSLRPCTDYWGLNEMTVKNKYVLSLFDEAFSPLHTARFFTTLDLQKAYHFIRIHQGDEWKTVSTGAL